jgi:asparagine synthase (glutamine-hydrolysing)
MESITPTLIHPEFLLDQFETIVSEFEEPFDGQCMLLRTAYGAAAADGRRVVLDGAGGDVVLGEGSYVVRLLRSGRFVRATKEIAGESHFWETDSAISDAFWPVRSAIAPEFIKRLRRERIGRKVENLIRDSLISHAFADDINLTNRVQRYQQTFPGGLSRDYEIECCDRIRPNMTAGRERYARIAATTATEASDPFLDKRVIDYCSRLPGRFRLRDGWPKIILRDLMAGRLPDELRWARGKHHLGWVFNTTVTDAAIAQGAVSVDILQETLKGYVDPGKIANAWRMIGDSDDLEPIHTAYLLSAWLRKNVRRPVVTS